MITSYALKPTPKMSSTLAINARVSELEAEGRHVLQLGFGEARFPVHPRVLAALKEHATARSYLPVSGLPGLRRTVADYYRRRFQINADPARVIVGSGSKSLLFAALYALEGDVVLPTPSWVSYETQARLVGKKIHEIPTHREENYYLSPARLRAGLKAARQERQSPAVLVLNTPHNPTGVMYPPQLLAELAEVAREEDLIILSDEIYALTAYGTVPHVSIARYYPEGTIITGGLSKHLSLGGWRLGVAILPEGEFGAQLQ
ncbi:MAG: pyridoxal phosphate-dependent aminotransferase, partial [Anaerolineae bacterium]